MIQLFTKLRQLIIQIIDWFYFPFLRFIPVETFRYGVTGGANAVLDILLYYVCYHYVLYMQNLDLGFIVISPHIAAFLMVFPITFSTGFLMAKYITFITSKLRGRKQLFRYSLSVAGSLFLNYVFLKLFVEVAEIYATYAKVLTTIIVVIYSYIVQRHFSFKTARILVIGDLRN